MVVRPVSRPGLYVQNGQIHIQVRGKEGQDIPPAISLNVVEALDVAQQIISYVDGYLLNEFPNISSHDRTMAWITTLHLYNLAFEAGKKDHG